MRSPSFSKTIIDNARSGGGKVTQVQKTKVLQPNSVRNIRERRRNVRRPEGF
jgi:hypothetical protein